MVKNKVAPYYIIFWQRKV